MTPRPEDVALLRRVADYLLDALRDVSTELNLAVLASTPTTQTEEGRQS